MKVAGCLLLCAASLAAQLSDPDSLFRQGLLLGRASRLSEAEDLFRGAAREYPRDKRFPLELAGVLYREHRPAAAERALRRALALDPDDAYALEFLGTLYLVDGNLAAALLYWNRVDKPLLQEVRLPVPPALDPILLARTLDLSGGQILTLRRLRQTEANLDRLDIFSGYRFDLTSREDQRYDLTVRLDPVAQPFGGWLGSIAPYLRGLPYQTLDIDRYNIGRRAINFTSFWRWDRNKRRIDTELSAPRYRLVLDARDELWDVPSLQTFRLRRIEAGGDLNAGLTGRLRWTGGVRVKGRWFAHAEANPIFASGWSSEVRNRLDYRLIDAPEHRLAVNASATFMTGGRPFHAKSSGELSASWFPQRTRDQWEVDARLRAARTFGAPRFDEYFQLGMERDNDLWFRGIVGTRDGRKGNAPLGVNYTLAQTDLQRLLFRAPFVSLKAGPFFDAGTISGPSPQFGSPGWLCATGVEARIRTLDRLNVSLVFGREVSSGQNVFYTAVTR